MGYKQKIKVSYFTTVYDANNEKGGIGARGLDSF